MEEVLRTGKSPQFEKAWETEIQTSAGERKIVTQASFPIKTERGYRMGSILRDITERKRMEEMSRKWASIFEHAEWGIVASSAR